MKNPFPRLTRARDKPQNALNGGAYSFFFGGTTSGKAVNERSAMQMTAVYACVRILAEAIASLPLHVYRYKDMSPPTKELMKLTLEQKIAHGGHPALRWMVDNVAIRTDPAGNIKADKEKSTEKIDGAVAIIMALDRVLRHGGETSGSVYDTRGLLQV